jgi:hypothetical protein
MRLNCTFETGDERYKWINEVVAIASSARCGNQGMELADVGTDHGQSSTTLTLLLEVRWRVQCIHNAAAMHGGCLLLPVAVLYRTRIALLQVLSCSYLEFRRTIFGSLTVGIHVSCLIFESNVSTV